MLHNKRVKTNRLYNIWYGMLTRCNNPKHEAYSNYGGRGIKVSFKDFDSFTEWALSNGYEEHLTIDRIDNNKDYSPDNCRWVTMKEQQNHRRNNSIYEYMGEKHTIAEWARLYGVPYDLLCDRLTREHMSIDMALTKPTQKRERKIEYKGEEHNLREWSEILGIPYYCLRSRFNSLHWTVEKAFETPYEGAKND